MLIRPHTLVRKKLLANINCWLFRSTHAGFILVPVPLPKLNLYQSMRLWDFSVLVLKLRKIKRYGSNSSTSTFFHSFSHFFFFFKTTNAWLEWILIYFFLVHKWNKSLLLYVYESSNRERESENLKKKKETSYIFETFSRNVFFHTTQLNSLPNNQ